MSSDVNDIWLKSYFVSYILICGRMNYPNSFKIKRIFFHIIPPQRKYHAQTFFIFIFLKNFYILLLFNIMYYIFQVWKALSISGTMNNTTTTCYCLINENRKNRFSQNCFLHVAKPRNVTNEWHNYEV